MLMLVFMFLHIVIPQPIVTLITPFANANTFCTMAMIGLMIGGSGQPQGSCRTGEGDWMEADVQRDHRDCGVVPVAV